MTNLKTVFLAATILSSIGIGAQASEDKIFDFGDKHNWMIRARAIDIHPDSDSSASGASVFVDNIIVPELDITYFWTDKIATELILATSKHDVETAGGTDLGSVWVLPPQLTAQYHFQPENDIFRPYVGAGLGYMLYFNEKDGALPNMEYDSGISYVFQAGADFPLDDHWAFNVDAKRVYHNVEASTNGTQAADVDLDPWVVGVGIGYRF